MSGLSVMCTLNFRDTIARENALKVLIRSNPAGTEEIEDERNR